MRSALRRIGPRPSHQIVQQIPETWFETWQGMRLRATLQPPPKATHRARFVDSTYQIDPMTTTSIQQPRPLPLTEEQDKKEAGDRLVETVMEPPAAQQ